MGSLNNIISCFFLFLFFCCSFIFLHLGLIIIMSLTLITDVQHNLPPGGAYVNARFCTIAVDVNTVNINAM